MVPIRKSPGDEWAESIPAQLTAREALVFVQRALAAADAATKAIFSRYGSGTLPPPPWPKHPALEKAIDAMDGGRLMLEQAIKLGHGDVKQPKDGPTGKRLLNGGRALYHEIAVMEKNLEGVKAEDIPGLIVKAATRAASTKLGGWVAVGLLLYALHEWDSHGHASEEWA